MVRHIENALHHCNNAKQVIAFYVVEENCGYENHCVKEYIEKEKLTAMMVTHNMQFAIEFGNRLIMMDEGHIIMDVSGDEKKNLTIPLLIERFRSASNKDFTSDEGLLTH